MGSKLIHLRPERLDQEIVRHASHRNQLPRGRTLKEIKFDAGFGKRRHSLAVFAFISERVDQMMGTSEVAVSPPDATSTIRAQNLKPSNRSDRTKPPRPEVTEQTQTRPIPPAAAVEDCAPCGGGGRGDPLGTAVPRCQSSAQGYREDVATWTSCRQGPAISPSAA